MFSVINCKLKIFREGVYYRRTNAVKSACYLISAAAELSTCVENGINYRCSRYFLLWVYTCRDTTSVIGNSDNVPGKYLYFYLSAISCQCLIDSVVNYLVDKVVKSLWTC